MTTTQELLKRLESGEVGRAIDAIIWYSMVEKPGPGEMIDQDMIDRWPAYTTDLNAAVALVERVRRGWRKGFRQHEEIEGMGWTAWIKSPDFRVEHYTAGGETRSNVTNGKHCAGDAPTPAAALIAALLRSEGE